MHFICADKCVESRKSARRQVHPLAQQERIALVDPTYLLSDEQMKEFIVNGFVKLNTELSPQVHQRIYERTEEVFEKEGNPGNNVLPRPSQVALPTLLSWARSAVCSVPTTQCAPPSSYQPRAQRRRRLAQG